MARNPEVGMTFIWDLDSGERLERPSVDAREMMVRGAKEDGTNRYSLTDPEGGRGATSPDFQPLNVPPGAEAPPGAAATAPEHPLGVPLTATTEATPAAALELPTGDGEAES